jgi:hypothetical protein
MVDAVVVVVVVVVVVIVGTESGIRFFAKF